MKRTVFICVLLCAIICGCAVCEGSVYQATWKSATGLTVVRVSAEVSAPEREAFDIVEVAGREFSDDEIGAFAQALFGAEAYSEAALGDVAHIGESSADTRIRRFVSQARNADGNYALSMFVIQTASSGGEPLSAKVLWSRAPIPGRGYFTYQGLIASDAPSVARGNSYTPAQALALAERVVSDMGVELSLAASGVISGALAGEDAKDPNIDSIPMADEQAYWFSFSRNISGAQVTYTTEQCDTRDDALISRPFGYETLNVVISDDGVYAVSYTSPYEIKGVIGESAQILPFEQINAIAQALLPLKYASRERPGELCEIEITHIKLGYTRVQLKHAPDKYALVPAWDYFGIISSNGSSGAEYLYQSLITINAIDGTVIDRNYGY